MATESLGRAQGFPMLSSSNNPTGGGSSSTKSAGNASDGAVRQVIAGLMAGINKFTSFVSLFFFTTRLCLYYFFKTLN